MRKTFATISLTALAVMALAQQRHTIFDSALGPEWVYLQNPDRSCYRLIDGKLRLTASSTTLTENISPTFIGRQQQSDVFRAETYIDFFESVPHDEAGLSVYQSNDVHADFCITTESKETKLCLKVRLKNLDVTVKSATLSLTCCHLRVFSDGKMYYFDYSTDGETYREFDKLDCSLLKKDTVDGPSRVIVGMYATMNPSYLGSGPSYADFSYFDYQEE